MFPVGYTTQITSYQWEEVKPINALSIWDSSIIVFGSKEQGWLENVVKSKLNNAKNTGGREKNESKEIVQKLGQGRATAEAEAISNADWQSWSEWAAQEHCPLRHSLTPPTREPGPYLVFCMLSKSSTTSHTPSRDPISNEAFMITSSLQTKMCNFRNQFWLEQWQFEKNLSFSPFISLIGLFPSKAHLIWELCLVPASAPQTPC